MISIKLVTVSAVLISSSFLVTRALLRDRGVARVATPAAEARPPQPETVTIQRWTSGATYLNAKAADPEGLAQRAIPVPAKLSRLQEVLLKSPRPEVQKSAHKLRNGFKSLIGTHLGPCWGEPSNDPFYLEISTQVVTTEDLILLQSPRLERVVGRPADEAALVACVERALDREFKMLRGEKLLGDVGPIDGEERFIIRSPEADACPLKR